MADLVLDTDLIGIGGAGTRSYAVQGSEAIDRGQPVILDTATNKYGVASADTAVNAVVKGLCVSPCGADGDYFTMLESGPVILGVVLLMGQIYVLSPTVGGGAIITAAELTTGNYVTILGIASSSTVLDFSPNVSGIVRA